MAVRMSPRTRVLAAVGGWLLAAGLATGAGMFAIGAIGDDISPDATRPLTGAQVAARANAVTGPPESGAPSRARKPGGMQVLGSPGGTVLARCVGRQVLVLSATPAQGYRVDDRDDDLEDTAQVKFTGGNTEVKVEVRCVGGIPRASSEIKAGDDADERGGTPATDTPATDGPGTTTEDDHGGDRHGGGGSDDGGSGGGSGGGGSGHGRGGHDDG